MDKVTAFGEHLKIGGSEVSNKITAGMSSMSFKVKELFQGPNPTDKIVEDATSENLEEPDWDMNLEICDMINQETINSVDLIPERILDEMVKLIDDPQIVVNNRNKALILIEAWGESTSELRYLPVFTETYKSFKARGIRFPGRDNESLAPIFTPARSAPAPEVNVDPAQHSHEP
ncbi:Target of Myb protein 1 [Raphanus sativus]|nr:Target of Myb protein 1 [Raphanus sativus]